jgi:hypothetical protein
VRLGTAGGGALAVSSELPGSHRARWIVPH